MLGSIIHLIFKVIYILIFIRVVISWITPYSRNDFVDIVYQITEPILKPFRFALPVKNLRIDFSPMFAYIVLNILERVIYHFL